VCVSAVKWTKAILIFLSPTTRIANCSNCINEVNLQSLHTIGAQFADSGTGTHVLSTVMYLASILSVFFISSRAQTCTQPGQQCSPNTGNFVWNDFFVCQSNLCFCNFVGLRSLCNAHYPIFLGSTNETIRATFAQNLPQIQAECTALINASECISANKLACSRFVYKATPPPCLYHPSTTIGCDCYNNGPRCILVNPLCQSSVDAQLLVDVNQYCSGYCSAVVKFTLGPNQDTVWSNNTNNLPIVNVVGGNASKHSDSLHQLAVVIALTIMLCAR